MIVNHFFLNIFFLSGVHELSGAVSDIKNPLKILYLDDDRDKDKYELFYLS